MERLERKDREYKNPNNPEIKEVGLNNKEFTLTYDYTDKDHNLISQAIKRTVSEMDNEGQVYYFIADHIDVENIGSDYQGTTLIFNGNGRFNHNNSFNIYGNLNVWTGECNTEGNKWKISSHHCALLGGHHPTEAYSNFFESDSENGTRASAITGGSLTRLEFFQPKKKKTIFHSVYFPQVCTDTLPRVFEMVPSIINW